MVEYIFLHQIGFFVIGTLALILALVTTTATVYLWLKLARMHNDLRIFFGGKKPRELEKTILAHAAELKDLDDDVQELFDISNRLLLLANRGLHKVAMLRFNPFKDLGGNQSFCIALLDGHNDGFVLLSLHTREGTRVYTKQIIAGVSPKHELTEEELHVITEAKKQVITPPK